ncbi:MAG: hemin-degrading factor [Sphingopyxis sp.]|nr:hemin-degrading factor [Sphingopyxis sp.]
MTVRQVISAADIRAARLERPDMRERDFAEAIGVSEGELLAAHIGFGVRAITPDPDFIIPRLNALGEVMALTRNDLVVHEKIGTYLNYVRRDATGLVLGPDIDMRIFPKRWAAGFAVEKASKNGAVSHSFQFFDPAGKAVHKVHTRPATDMAAWDALAAEGALAAPEGAAPFSSVGDDLSPIRDTAAQTDVDGLVDEWANMQDTHEVPFILAGYKLKRAAALPLLGPDFAIGLPAELPARLVEAAAQRAVPLLIFARSTGCLQVHNGTVCNIVPMGPWINVMDARFHMHLRTDRTEPVHLVRKPTRHGDVVSVEVMDAGGDDALLFTAVRTMQGGDDTVWRALLRHIIEPSIVPTWL